LGAIQGPTPENVIGTIVIRVSLSPRALRNVITTAHWQYGGGNTANSLITGDAPPAGITPSARYKTNFGDASRAGDTSNPDKTFNTITIFVVALSWVMMAFGFGIFLVKSGWRANYIHISKRRYSI
jgi:hypothetical protein